MKKSIIPYNMAKARSRQITAPDNPGRPSAPLLYPSQVTFSPISVCSLGLPLTKADYVS
jgi:hypothetical protein